MIKLVALDLDNTLLTNDKKISKTNEQALKAISAKGVKVVLCTGRPINAIWHYIEQLGLTGLMIIRSPLTGRWSLTIQPGNRWLSKG